MIKWSVYERSKDLMHLPFHMFLQKCCKNVVKMFMVLIKNYDLSGCVHLSSKRYKSLPGSKFLANRNQLIFTQVIL